MVRPLISIIVPVYNVEQYLDRCVHSLVNQTMYDIEIILVDDGSPDNCPKMCDEYAKRDIRIRVIHKKNGGLSEARNIGLKEAIGEYILFVDSDDYLSKEACEILYLNINNDSLDVIIGEAIVINNNNETYMKPADISLDRIMTGNEFLKEQLMVHSMHMAVWLNLYNKEFLINNNLFFEKGIYHEDEEWTPQVFLKANKVKYVKTAFYYYFIREDSITRKKDKSKNGVDLINTCYKLEKIFDNIEDKELKLLLNDNLVILFLHAIHLGNLYSKENILYQKKFLIGKSKSIKNMLKVFLFILNKKIYKYANNLYKS